MEPVIKTFFFAVFLIFGAICFLASSVTQLPFLGAYITLIVFILAILIFFGAVNQ